MAHTIANEDIYVNGTIIPCKNDFDCPFTAVCYNNSRISKYVGQCGCDYEWGEIGNECDQSGPMAYFQLGFFSVFVIISMLSFIYLLKEIWCIHKTEKGLKQLDVKTTSMVACALTYLSFSLYAIGGISIIMDPVAEKPDGIASTKKRKFSSFRAAFLALFTLFLIATFMNVSILWLEVAIASKKFKRINNPQLSRNYRYAVITFDVLAAIIVACISWYNSSYTGIVGVVFIAIVTLT